MTMKEPWIRVPRVHTGTGPPPEPIPCRDVCVTCRRFRHHCDLGPPRCAPICEKANIAPGPVHVCLITTFAAGRLIFRTSRLRTTYIGPSGIEHPPPPISWPLLVVDHCPHDCGRIHLHTIRDPGPIWYRRGLNCRPYLVYRRTR